MEESVLAILNSIVNYMEKNGATRSTVFFDIDESLVNEIYESTDHQYSLEELQQAADKCIAHEWLKHRSIGEKYRSLEITEKGVGIVRSLRQQELSRKNRKLLKKVSDYINEHSGLMLFLGFVVALAGLFIKFL